MPHTTRAQCPACGANVADDGRSRVIECTFCGTSVTIARDAPPPAPRTSPPPRAPMMREEPHTRIELAAAFEADADVQPRESSGCGVSFLIACGIGIIVVLAHSLIVTNFYRDMDAYNGGIAPAMGMSVALGVPVLALLIWLIRRVFR